VKTAQDHYDPKDIGTIKAPAQTDPNEPYLKQFDQKGFSELSKKYQRGETALKTAVAKLAMEHPELRVHLVPLLRESSATKVAHRPILQSYFPRVRG
jgi:hypothetical protein